MGKMYHERTQNIAVFRGCSFGCVYCSFKRLVQLNKKCPACAIFKPHSHMEVLKRTAPSTKDGNFVTVGLSGDVSFMLPEDFQKVLDYCESWIDTTFLIQSKNPEYFVKFLQEHPESFIAENTILGATIETVNTGFFRDPRIGDVKGNFITYSEISKAPYPAQRYEAMLNLTCRKAVTIEPIIAGDLKTLARWVIEIAPEFCYIGYNSKSNLHLPEPILSKTMELITQLEAAGIEVRKKLLRKAFYE